MYVPKEEALFDLPLPAASILQMKQSRSTRMTSESFHLIFKRLTGLKPSAHTARCSSGNYSLSVRQPWEFSTELREGGIGYS